MADINIGRRLKEARERMNFTQDQVAKKIGIEKYQTLSAYENGVNSPPLDRLKDLAILYGVSTDWILFGDETRLLKTPKDYLCQLIEATEELGLTLTQEVREYKQNPYGFTRLSETVYLIDLSQLNDRCEDFLSNWYQLKKVYDNKIIQRDLYDMGLGSHIKKLPNDLQQVTNEELDLPF